MCLALSSTTCHGMSNGNVCQNEMDERRTKGLRRKLKHNFFASSSGKVYRTAQQGTRRWKEASCRDIGPHVWPSGRAPVASTCKHHSAHARETCPRTRTEFWTKTSLQQLSSARLMLGNCQSQDQNHPQWH